MERLRQMFAYINSQFAVLSVSQRVALGLCAAMIAGSLIWLTQWSSAPDLVPLVRQDFGYDGLDTVEQALKANGVRYQISGNRVFVREADRHNALRLIHGAGALPEGSLFDMATVVSSERPFQAPEAREYAQNYATGNELAKIIGTSPSVRQCSVIINPRTRRRLGGHADEPSASVTVSLMPGVEMTSGMVDGFAKLVAGAVAGLRPHNVYITDARTLRAYNVPTPEDAVSYDYLQLVKQRETHLREKILQNLSGIPGVQVAVTVELDTSKRVTQKMRHDAPQPRLETTQMTETSSGPPATEPGVQPNMGQAVTAAGGGSGSTTEETHVENFEPKLSETETVEHLPFATRSVTAAVGIPRSFVANVFKARFPEGGEPKEDDEQFVAIREEQMARVRNGVERIIMARRSDDVEVSVYPDIEWTVEGGSWSRHPAGVAMAQAGSEALDPLGLLQTYGPGLGLGFLALCSLFMMTRLVRKAAPPEGYSASGRDRGESHGHEPMLVMGGRTVGRAEVSEGMLVGREVDDDTLRYQELNKEVSKLVEKDPEGAAGLIRRWIEEPA